MSTIGSARLRVLVAGTTPDSRSSSALADTLVAHLRRQGHDADSVMLPLHADRSQLLAHACAWRMLNLSVSNARRVDLVIATAFPAWCTRHPHKIAWIALDGPTADDEPPDDARSDPDRDVTPDAERTSRQLRDLDSRALAECRHVFAGGASTAERLKRRTGIDARLLPYPSDTVRGETSGSAGDPAVVWDSIIEQLLG